MKASQLQHLLPCRVQSARQAVSRQAVRKQGGRQGTGYKLAGSNQADRQEVRKQGGRHGPSSKQSGRAVSWQAAVGSIINGCLSSEGNTLLNIIPS